MCGRASSPPLLRVAGVAAGLLGTEAASPTSSLPPEQIKKIKYGTECPLPTYCKDDVTVVLQIRILPNLKTSKQKIIKFFFFKNLKKTFI